MGVVLQTGIMQGFRSLWLEELGDLLEHLGILIVEQMIRYRGAGLFGWIETVTVALINYISKLQSRNVGLSCGASEPTIPRLACLWGDLG
jgi:hypothetical protein